MFPRALVLVSLFVFAACGGCEEEGPSTSRDMGTEDASDMGNKPDSASDMPQEDAGPEDMAADAPQCVPDASMSDEEICGQAQVACGEIQYTNDCGMLSTISCGGCAGGNTCEEGQCVASYLYATDPNRGAAFGGVMRQDEDTLVVAATRHTNGGGVRAGAVFVYEREDDGSWGEGVRLEAVDTSGAVIGKANDAFGYALDVDGDVLVVGAPGRELRKGAVFVYERDIRQGWALRNELEIPGSALGDRCGAAVGVSDGMIAVGCPDDGLSVGVVHIFEFNILDSKWVATRKLERPEFLDFSRLGAAIEISKDYLVLGAPGANDDQAGTNAGAVLVYPRSAQGLNLPREIRSSTAQSESLFGSSLALDGTTLAVGQTSDVGLLLPDEVRRPGEVVLFMLLGDGASERAVLTAAKPAAGDQFGLSLALQGDHLGVFGWGPQGSDKSHGAATYFVRDMDGTWNLKSTLEHPMPEDSKGYGSSMSFDTEHLLLGVPGNDDKFNDAGAVRLLDYESL